VRSDGESDFEPGWEVGRTETKQNVSFRSNFNLCQEIRGGVEDTHGRSRCML
jgi:hypothetical protein